MPIIHLHCGEPCVVATVPNASVHTNTTRDLPIRAQRCIQRAVQHAAREIESGACSASVKTGPQIPNSLCGELVEFLCYNGGCTGCGSIAVVGVLLNSF